MGYIIDHRDKTRICQRLSDNAVRADVPVHNKAAQSSGEGSRAACDDSRYSGKVSRFLFSK